MDLLSKYGNSTIKRTVTTIKKTNNPTNKIKIKLVRCNLNSKYRMLQKYENINVDFCSNTHEVELKNKLLKLIKDE